MSADDQNKTAAESIGAPATGGSIVTAAMLVIGDEVLSGRTKERNIGYFADLMTSLGIRLREARIVPDVTEEIIAAVNELRARYDYVVTTGGIGPTHDDITADAIAKAFGVSLDVDERALALMRPHYESRGLELTSSRLRMARIPEGATLIKNRISIAPGFMLGNVFVLAGVPDIMQVMLDDAIQHMRTGARMLSRSILVKAPEGELADMFAQHQKEFPDIAMGSYPAMVDRKLECELVLRSIDADRLDAAYTALHKKLALFDIS